MTLVRNVVFALLFFGGSVPIVIAAAFMTLFGARAAQIGADAWSAYVLWLVRHILGIRIEMHGAMPDAPCIVAPKHESNLETFALPALFPFPAVVMKRELMRIPVWGWIARRHGSIPVDRNAKASALRAMLRAAEAAKANERHIIIFPEGTRTPAGESPALKPGVAGLYRLLKLPVVPVSLSSAHLWPKSGFKRPGTLYWRFHDPIPPGLPRAEFERRLHGAINGKEVCS